MFKIIRRIKRLRQAQIARKNREFWANVTDSQLIGMTSLASSHAGEILHIMRKEKKKRERLRTIRSQVQTA